MKPPAFSYFTLAILLSLHSVSRAQAYDEIQLLPPIGSQEQVARADSSGTPAPSPIAEQIQQSLRAAEEVSAELAEEVSAELAEESAELAEEQAPSGWFYPRIWRPSKIWEGGVEFGLNGSHGNTNTLSLTGGANATRTEGPTTLTWDLVYIKTQTDSVETQHNTLMSCDYKYDFDESCWSWFSKFYGEYDEFKAFDLRLSLNTGAGYDLIKTETKQLTGRFGAGWSREINGPDNRFVSEATFGAHYERQLMDRQKLVIDSQYLPEWEGFSNYRMINDAHWQILLNEESDLHLKISLIDRYDSTPNGVKANDLTYSILLLWKI